MTERQFRGVLIGCGYVSKSHMAGWRCHSDAAIVAVCDLDGDRARRTAEQWKVLRSYTSAASALAAEKPDFVEICTRPDSHEALVALAASHGCHILCQKPIADDLATIDRMRKTADAARIRIMVHENWRYRPWYVEMARQVHAGIVGRPIRLRLNIHDDRCIAPGGLSDQPYFAVMPKFILYEMGPHAVDAARQILGDPETVFCTMQRAAPIAGEDSAHLVLGYADGAAAILDLNWSTPMHPCTRIGWGFYETVVEGTSGTLRTSTDGQLELLRPGRNPQPIPVKLSDDPRVESYAAVQRHFLDCLRSGAEFVTSLADNRKAMAMIFAGYESAATGSVVRL